MQLRLAAVLAALTLAPLIACDDGGTATPGTTTPGSEESAFDDYFSFGGGERATANDSTGTSQEACVDDNCTGEPYDPEAPVYTPPVCESPLAPPAGAMAACQAFCAKVTGCMGEPAAEAACATDCKASLAGTELAGVQQIFGCITAASCEDIADWNGGGGTSTGDPRDDVPPTYPSGAGSGSDGAPIPEGDGDEEPLPPREGDPPEQGEVVVTVNPIGECMDAVFAGWVDATIPAGKQGVCAALPANEERCGGSNTVTSGSGSASSNATPEGNASESAGGSGASDSNGAEPDQAPPQEDPMPYEEHEEDYSDAQTQCHAFASLLSAQTMTRIGACDAMDCDARDACLEQILVCAPFIEVLYFAGGSSVSVDVAEPSETNPDEGTSTDPEPAPR